MSARARALAYANSVANKKGRKQPDNFGKPKTGPPSYAFQNDQRGQIDDIADETSALRAEEKKIADDKEEDVIDKADFTPGPSKGKAPAAAKTTSGPAAPAELKSAFAKCWTIVDTIDIPAVQHDDKSWYFPNAISLFETLSAMEDLLSENEELKWVSPHYFSLPVRVYYAVLFHVQVLRAQEQAGTLTKAQGSWLRAYFRRFKDTMCPVAGPLVPIFSNIVSCLPDDDQFDYVYPTLPPQGSYYTTHTTTGSTTTISAHTRSQHHLVPSVAMVASLLRKFCRSATLPTTNFDASGQYVPFTVTTGGDFAGYRFPAHTAGANNSDTAQLLTNPAIMHPLPESKDRLKEIHGFWKRSKAKNIPEILTSDPYTPMGPGDMTLMTDNFDWFQPCVDMANVQTKFFSDSVNLSAIPTVGGMSSLVTADLAFTDEPTLPNTIDDWYPDLFSSCKASFKATASELTLDNKYAAAYALTNATLEWKTAADHKIGSFDNGARAGPYFENSKITYQAEHPVPVMSGIYTMIQTQFYDAHAKA